MLTKFQCTLTESVYFLPLPLTFLPLFFLNAERSTSLLTPTPEARGLSQPGSSVMEVSASLVDLSESEAWQCMSKQKREMHAPRVGRRQACQGLIPSDSEGEIAVSFHCVLQPDAGRGMMLRLQIRKKVHPASWWTCRRGRPGRRSAA